MFFLTLLVFGLRSYRELPLNLMPDIAYPTLTVRTEFEGSAPEDVEKLLTRPLEERLTIVSGVRQVSSISSAELSEIILEFAWGTDMNVALQDVRESLDLFDQPLAVTRKPVILRYDPTLDPVMRIALTAGTPGETIDRDTLRVRLTAIREAAEEQVKSDLEAETGIAQVSIEGGREREIQIRVDSERLKSLGLNLGDVVSALEQQNINLSGGTLREGKAEYFVRTLNEFEDIDEIRAVIVRVERPQGAPALHVAAEATASARSFRLDDLADVQFGEKEPETIIRINGQEAVELKFYKEGDANVVEVCDTLRAFFYGAEPSMLDRATVFLAEHVPLSRLQKMRERIERRKRLRDKLASRLPDYTIPTLITDQSRFISAAIREVQKTALVGGMLALAMLFVFLREFRSTVIVGVAIPISVIATFVPMFAGGISLNIMSLGGLALGIGMLVDNSIVVLESIFRCREEGDDLLAAADRGTREVAGAVTASTLTTIAVFFPLVFVEGIAGQLFRDLALTVTFSLLASLLVALYLIPMIASREPVPFARPEGVVWFLRSYRHSRGAEGGTAGRALTQIPGAGVQYALEWIRDTWSDTVGAALRGTRRVRVDAEGASHSHSLPVRFAWAVSIPFALVLFLLQSALKLLAATITTILFLATLPVLAVLWLTTRMLRLVLFIPVMLFDRMFIGFRDAYTVGLRRAIRFAPVILLVVLGAAVHAGMTARSLGRELIPPLKQGEFGIRLETPAGTRLEDTERRAQIVEAAVRANPHVESVAIQVGSETTRAGEERGENVATLTVKLRNPEETAAIQDEIMEDIRRQVLAVTADEVTFTLPTLFSFNTAVEIQIFGEDTRILRRVGEEALAAIRDVPGLEDPQLSLKRGYPEIHITLDRELLAEKNISPYEVAQRLRTEVQGEVATRLRESGRMIDIRVRSDQEQLKTIEDLRNLSVTDGNPPTPLSSVAKIEIAEGPSQIRRVDQREAVIVSANVQGRDLGSVNADIDRRLALLQQNWPKGYFYALGGQNRELQESYNSLMFALLLAIFLVYVVMACQFESVWHPALILFSVPLAFIGVVYVLYWFSISFSVVVLIGGIVLSGIVVNDAIVLVDYINQLRERGRNKIDAVVEAGRVRFRPIMMTTLTTVLGLVPMAISGGEGAEIRGPMAITIMAGLLSATLLTLVIIPLIYTMFAGRDRA